MILKGEPEIYKFHINGKPYICMYVCIILTIYVCVCMYVCLKYERKIESQAHVSYRGLISC